MKVLDFLDENTIKLNLASKTKAEVIEELVDLLVKAKKITDKKNAIKTLLDREELGSTGIGQGVAIPHGKTETIKELVSAFGLSKQGIAFDALDGEPVNLFFLLLAPEGSAGAHLKALARISSLLKDKHFRKALMNATNKEEIIKIIKEEERLKGYAGA